MPTFQRDTLLKAIKDRMDALPESDAAKGELGGLWIKVNNWDGQGEPAFLRQLSELMINVEPTATTSPEVRLTETQVKAIPRGFNDYLRDADEEESRRLQEAGKSFHEWNTAGQISPLPHADHELSALTTSTSSNGEAAWLAELEQARKLYADKKYYLALDRLKSLGARASSEWVDQLKHLQDQAERALSQQEEELITAALQVVKQSPNNLKHQETAWEKVQEANPDSERANDELYALSQRRAQEDLRAKLENWQHDLTQALQAKDLLKINEVRGNVEASLQRSNAGLLGEDLFARLSSFSKGISKSRQQLSDNLGVATTLLLEGDVLAAYVQAKEYIESATLVIPVDATSGNLFEDTDLQTDSSGQKYVETHKLFTLAAQRLISGLRTNAQERITRAKIELEGNPTLARDTLEKALELLNPEEPPTTEEKKQGITQTGRPALLKAHTAELQGIRDDVKQALETVRPRQEHYEQASAKLTQAFQLSDPLQQLQLLVAAANDFANYPGLKEAEETARRQYANHKVNELDGAISNAQLKTIGEQFTQARELLALKRVEALQPPPASLNFADAPWPPPNSTLAQQVEKVRVEEQNVAQAEQAYAAMVETLKEAEKHIGTGGESALELARNLLDALPDQARKHKLVITTQAHLTTKRGDSVNWEEGRTKFELSEWDLAEPPLKRVAEGASAAKADAERLLKLIQAVRHMQNAQTAAAQGRWGEALRHYQSADRFFQANYNPLTDTSVSDFVDTCRSGLQDLAPLAETDRQVKRVLDSIQTGYQQLTGVADQRKTMQVSDKVQPLGNVAALVQELQPLRQRKSNYLQAVEELSGNIQDLWRTTYIAGMEATRGCQDNDLLKEALARAEDLKQARLLYRDSDKTLVRQLQLEQLEVDYEQLRAKVEPDWLALAENRRKKCEVLGLRDPQREKVFSELQNAQREHLLAEARRLENNGPAGGAQKYLEEQLNTSYHARTDPRLIQTLIEVCWCASDFPAAGRAAHYFADLTDPASSQLETVWQHLTKAAQDFAKNDLKLGLASLQEARKAGQATEISTLVDLQERNFKKAMCDRLLLESQTAEEHSNFLAAAEKLALAHAANNTSALVLTRLEALGGKVTGSLQTLVQKAHDFRLGTQKLEKAIEESSQLIKSLEDLQCVADLLKLDSVTKDNLEAALDEIREISRPWQSLQASLDAFDHELATALITPQPIDEDGQGGWSLVKAGQHLATAEKLVPANQDTARQLVKPRRERFNEFDNTANTLHDLIIQFMTAVKTETFESVIQQAELLERQWQRAAPRGWAGLETLVDYAYPSDKKSTNRLREHREKAIRQLEDFTQWETWRSQTQKAYEAVLKAEKDMLSKPLEELVFDQSLKELEKSCQKAKDYCRTIENALTAEPQQGPISERAERAKDAVLVEPYRRKAGECNGRFEQLIQDARKRHDKFEAEYRTLQRLIDGLKNPPPQSRWPNRSKRIVSPPMPQIQQARLKWDVCSELDPLNEKLQPLREYLETLPGT